MFPNHIHSSWEGFLTCEVIEKLNEIENKIGDHYNPVDPKNILRFLSVDLQQVKVIWLGQDVYPAGGVATGRSFEVGNLQSWHEPFRQTSLKNIVRLIHKNYSGIENYNEIKKFKEIQQEISSGKFPIKPPMQWFDSLEQQGVLFLNCSYTCEIGVKDSHKHIWEAFSIKVLRYISSQRPDIIWFLWGTQATANKENIEQGQFFESRHPMMCSEKYNNDFLKFEGFKATMDKINWLG